MLGLFYREEISKSYKIKEYIFAYLKITLMWLGKTFMIQNPILSYSNGFGV